MSSEDPVFSGRRRFIVPAMVAVVSGLVAFLLVEGLARMLFPDWAPQTARLASFWKYDPIYGWSHNPGQRGRFVAAGFDTSVTINSSGFRGRETSFTKPAGTRHIVVLGDSMVWGFGVEEHEVFTHLLDEKLKPGARVINLGVSGYSTDQELLLYRDHGRRYQPDTVVLVIANNDIGSNAATVAYGIYGKPVFRLADDTLTLTNQPVPQSPWYQRAAVRVGSWSYVLSQLNRVRSGVRLFQPASAYTEQEWEDLPFPRNQAERVTLRLIDQVRRDVEADGATFIAFLVDRAYHGQSFRQALTGLDIDVVAFDDHLANRTDAIHVADDLHWNALGHRLVADALLPHLTDATKTHP